MKITRVWVENFRAISELEVEFGANTALLGENNSGKSSLLSAIRLFFESAPRTGLEDYHNKDSSRPVKVSVEFQSLTPEEEAQFAGNLIDGKLRIVREFHHNDPQANGKFFVQADVFLEFSACRAITAAAAKRDSYRELRVAYPELPAAARAEDIDGYLEAWEAAHPDLLTRQMVAGFRGFKNVAIGQLRKKTEIVYVPAVRDAGDELGDDKRSPVKQLLNTIAKQTIENSAEFREFKQKADEELRKLTSPENVPELVEISSSLTEILSRYYKGSELIASWEPVTNLPIQYPQSDLKVKDHSFESSIDNVGHGLQRAILFSVLEYLARDRALKADDGETPAEFEEPQSDIILLIEEPEIYQHPIKQRLFRHAFKALTDGFGQSSGIRMQVIYTTHSALMVDIRDFDEICVLRRCVDSNPPQVTTRRASIDLCAEQVAGLKGEQPDQDKYRLGLHIFTPEIAEGFFANRVVLVEGVGDKSILEAFYRQMPKDFLSEGIYVVDAVGKKKFDKPLAIFSQLGIPTFCIFDNDRPKGKDAAYNRLIQSLCAHDDPTDWPEGCFARHAAFEGNLEAYIKTVVGPEEYYKQRNAVCALNDINVGDAFKSPLIASELFSIFSKGGHKFDLLSEITEAVDAM
tara:strand:- start:92 stop:1993 length:1902 start_codon:yes stop_codon:yes gene_type:complete